MEVKELKEAIVGFAEVAIILKKVMKDGKIGVTDLMTLSTADLSKIMAGVNGIEKAVAEIKDIDMVEAKEVMDLFMAELKKVQAA